MTVQDLNNKGKAPIEEEKKGTFFVSFYDGDASMVMRMNVIIKAGVDGELSQHFAPIAPQH